MRQHRIRESAATVEDEALRVHEAAAPLGVIEANTDGPFQSDGTVLVHIIRPCAGKGRGRHIYEAAMLEREASKFAGWPMFIDHESPEAQRKSGGLPPSISRLGGEIVESWWDPSIPAEGRFGQGGVVGRAKPTPWMVPVIEAVPRQVQVSLNTFATGVQPRRTSDGTRSVVEGFADEGSVDWVTKAGAGGKIVRIMEAWFEDDDADHDREAADWLRKHRPAVAEALTNDKPNHGEEEDDVKPEQVIEAFDAMDDDGRAKVAEAVLESEGGQRVVQEAVTEALKVVVPQAMEAAAEVIERRAVEAVDQRIGLGDLRADAEKRLAEAELAPWAREDALVRVREASFEPVPADDKGEGAKTAREVMESVVDAEIARVTKLQEAAGWKPDPTPRRATTVSGNGAGGSDDRRPVREHDDRAGDWRGLLQEGGIREPDKAYAIQEADPGKSGKDKGDE